jgi:two-component system NtrC family response regulator
LYLDDVTEAPSHLQVELTQLLHESENGEMADSAGTAVRIIASTSMRGNLVAAANLRPDLYYRLSVVPLHLPPLRERKEDLPELIEVLADRIAKRHKLAAPPIHSEVHDRFAQYHWPGNVRELENVIERMLLFAADFDLSEQELTTDLTATREKSVGSFAQDLPENGFCLAQLERDLLVAALAKFGGNQTKAARYLNISRRTLIYRMGKYKLRTPDTPEHH